MTANLRENQKTGEDVDSFIFLW